MFRLSTSKEVESALRQIAEEHLGCSDPYIIKLMATSAGVLEKERLSREQELEKAAEHTSSLEARIATLTNNLQDLLRMMRRMSITPACVDHDPSRANNLRQEWYCLVDTCYHILDT